MRDLLIAGEQLARARELRREKRLQRKSERASRKATAAAGVGPGDGALVTPTAKGDGRRRKAAARTPRSPLPDEEPAGERAEEEEDGWCLEGEGLSDWGEAEDAAQLEAQLRTQATSFT